RGSEWYGATADGDFADGAGRDGTGLLGAGVEQTARRHGEEAGRGWDARGESLYLERHGHAGRAGLEDAEGRLRRRRGLVAVEAEGDQGRIVDLGRRSGAGGGRPGDPVRVDRRRPVVGGEAVAVRVGDVRDGSDSGVERHTEALDLAVEVVVLQGIGVALLA